MHRKDIERTICGGQKSPTFFMVGLENNIQAFVEEFLKDSEYFVVDVVRGASNKKTKISVYLDSDTSVAIEKCAEVSRYVTGRVEEELNYDEPYVIEVSSAGLDKPLQLKRQYVKNIGRKVEVLKSDGEKVVGKLTKVSDEEIEVVKEKTKKNPEKQFVININNIKSTKVKISF